MTRSNIASTDGIGVAQVQNPMMSPQACDIWQEPNTGMEFVWVPGGTFPMGCGSFTQEFSCDDDEKPDHSVSLDGFWLGKFPVTQGNWKSVMMSNPSHFPLGDDFPVESVSWRDVQAFIKILNEMGEERFCLPTEAEWEYACRSGGKAERYSGSQHILKVAWCGIRSQTFSALTTHAVGAKLSNGLGIFDMSGNVWEWVEDWYSETFYGTPQARGHNPVCTNSFSNCRVVRGGSWDSDPCDVRSTKRNKKKPGIRSEEVGFRLVRLVPGTQQASLLHQTPTQSSVLSAFPITSVDQTHRVIREWQPGEVILNLYDVVDKLGEGSFGTVHRVRHRQWQSELAVKSPKVEIVARTGGLDDFAEEAEAWVNLGLHPHIVNCHYVREIDGIPRIFLECVEGGSLASWICTEEGQPGRLYEGNAGDILERILDIAIQFAWGLDFAHGNGIIHQDVKPANVMLTPEGIVKVTDFGLVGAKGSWGERGADRTMLTDGMGGSPAYCSPEQAAFLFKNEHSEAGQEKTFLTRRSDLWSWAVCVLEMLVGKRRWQHGHVAGANFAFYLRTDDGPNKLDIPNSLENLLKKCFQIDPDKRYRSMKEVVEELIKIFEEVAEIPYERHNGEIAIDSPENFNNRAISRQDLGDRIGASQIFDQILTLYPSHLEATFNRLLLNPELNLLKGFLPAYHDNKGQWLAEYLMAYCHFRVGDWNAAWKLLGNLSVDDQKRPEVGSLLHALRQVNPKPPPSRNLMNRIEGIQTGVLITHKQQVLTGSQNGFIKLWEIGIRGRCLQTFAKQSAQVLELSLSGDSRWALSGGGDGCLKLWDLTTGCNTNSLVGHEGAVYAVCLNFDGSLALSGGDDQTVRFWSTASGRCLFTLLGHTMGVCAVFLSQDCRYAVSGGGSIRLWDLVRGECIRIFEGHAQEITSVFFAGKDDCWILSGSRDKTLKLWDIGSGDCLRTFEGHDGMVLAASLGGGRLILSGDDCGILRLWDIASGHCIHSFQGHDGAVVAVSLSNDDRLAFSMSKNEAPKLWDLSSIQIPEITVGVQLARFVRSEDVLRAHQDCDQTMNLARGAWREKQYVTTAQLVRQIRCLPGLNYHPDAMEFWQKLYQYLPRGVWKGCWKSLTLPGHDGTVLSVVMGEDGRRALTGSEDHTIKLWEVDGARCFRTFTGHSNAVTSVCLNSADDLALSGSLDATIRLWDNHTSQCLRSFTGHTSGVLAVALSSDGRWVLSGSADQSLKLWDVASGRCLHTCDGHEDAVTAVSLSADGRLALSGSNDKTIRLWSTITGYCLKTMVGHSGQVLAVCLSEDGRLALSGGTDMSVKLWDVTAGRCLHTFVGHTGAVSSVALSSDNRLILSASKDQTLTLWEVASGQRLRTFEGQTGMIYSTALSKDCRVAVSGSQKGSLDLWFFDWELEEKAVSYWSEDAKVILEVFLTQHMPYAGTLPHSRLSSKSKISRALIRQGRPHWTEHDFDHLLAKLGYAGFGWLRPEGVQKKLEEIAENWEGVVVSTMPYWSESLPTPTRGMISSIWHFLENIFDRAGSGVVFVLVALFRAIIGLINMMNQFLLDLPILHRLGAYILIFVLIYSYTSGNPILTSYAGICFIIVLFKGFKQS